MGMKGQGSVEFVLLLFLGVVIFIGGVNILKSKGFIKGLTVSPWAVVSGMVECGVWAECGIAKPVPMKHPNNRVVSYVPQGNQ